MTEKTRRRPRKERSLELLPEYDIAKPFDMHVHFRQDDILKLVVPYTARQFAKAIVMPNTNPPITNTELAKKYKQEILNAVPENMEFEPLIMFYITPHTDVDDIASGHKEGIIFGGKLYINGVTTNSNSGVNDVTNVYHVFKKMEEIGMPLSIHGEDNDPSLDIYDREKSFFENILPDIVKNFPALKITLEHITTKFAAEYIKNSPENIACTITPQHLMYDRNDMLSGGIRPHLYCLPILKKNIDKEGLRELVKSGHPRVFLGTDSAPHTQDNKETSCGCAGVFSAVNALEFYIEVFEELDICDKFEDFALNNAANFHGLEKSNLLITLIKSGNFVPRRLTSPVSLNRHIIPLMSDKIIKWRADYEVTPEMRQAMKEAMKKNNE